MKYKPDEITKMPSPCYLEDELGLAHPWSLTTRHFPELHKMALDWLSHLWISSIHRSTARLLCASTINKDSDACDRAVSHLGPWLWASPVSHTFCSPSAPRSLALSRKVWADPQCLPNSFALHTWETSTPPAGARAGPSHESPSARPGSVPGSAAPTAADSSHSAP